MQLDAPERLFNFDVKFPGFLKFAMRTNKHEVRTDRSHAYTQDEWLRAWSMKSGSRGKKTDRNLRTRKVSGFDRGR